MKFIKFILCLSIILFAFPAASEIYKYVDENGNTHFTDDFSQVPVEQRPTVDVSAEYENNTDSESIAESGVSDETEEGFTDESGVSDETENDFTDESMEEGDEFAADSENQDDEYDSAGTVDEENIVALGRDSEAEPDFSATSDEDPAKNDLDEIPIQLDIMKKEIDAEYQELVKEKEQLSKEKKTLKGHDEILKHNKKVERLNKKVEAYANKGKKYEARVEAYNEWIRQENAKLKKKKETP